MPSIFGNQKSNLSPVLLAEEGHESAPGGTEDEIYISFFNGQPQASADSFQCSADSLSTGFFGKWDL